MRIFISACGEGLGHTSRMLSLYRALEEAGHDAVIAGYGFSLERIQGERANWFRTFPEVRMVGKGGRFDLINSIISSAGTPADILRAYLREKAYIQRNKIDAVVSDSRLSTVLAGESAGLPTFYVTNQTQFQLPAISRVRRLQAFRLLEQARIPTEAVRRIIDFPLSLPYGFSDQILIPDFAPPDTICLPLLSREFEMRKKTYFTGPMSMLCVSEPPAAAWKSEKMKVLVTLGGQQMREGLVEEIAGHASRLPEFEFLISSIFVKKDRDAGNVRLRRFLPAVAPYAKAADILVIPAGHSSIMESVILRKPSIVIPDKGQPEQESNAHEYERLGFGRALTADRLDRLGACLRELSGNYSAHLSKLSPLSRRAKGRENGARNAAGMVEEFVERISY